MGVPLLGKSNVTKLPGSRDPRPPANPEQPVQVECELVVYGPNGETMVSSHTYNLLLPTPEQIARGIFESESGRAMLDVKTEGVVQTRARATFRRVQ